MRTKLSGSEEARRQRGCGNQRFEAKVGQARQAYKRMDIAVKMGLNAVDKEFDRREGVQDLDKEEERLVKAFLKEEGGNRGGENAQEEGA